MAEQLLAIEKVRFGPRLSHRVVADEADEVLRVAESVGRAAEVRILRHIPPQRDQILDPTARDERERASYSSGSSYDILPSSSTGRARSISPWPI